jgi:hypothetical protein
VKRQPADWEEIFVTYLYDKVYISRVSTQQLNTKRTNNPINKQDKELNRKFSKEKLQRIINS